MLIIGQNAFDLYICLKVRLAPIMDIMSALRLLGLQQPSK
jgi:hypothetical protein